MPSHKLFPFRLLKQESTLDEVEHYFISTTQAYQTQQELVFPKIRAQQILAGFDAMLLLAYCAAVSFVAPQMAATVYVLSILMFMSGVYSAHIYALERNYYVLGKWMPFAVLFLTAQAWWLPDGLPRAIGLLAGIVMFALMMIAHHLGSRPYAIPRSGGVCWYLETKMKRVMDIGCSLLALVALAPLLLGVSLINWLQDPKSHVLYWHPRYGYQGKLFTIFKFRTMIPNAEKMIEKTYQELEGQVFKDKEDFRITRFGKLLRNTSIDELPQLINILFGDMSIVGPRPFMRSEHEKMPLWQQKSRSRMKPGLTCLWQINGRVHGHRDFDSIAVDDNRYINTWCLMNDLLIILKTVPVVLLQKGGY